MFAIRTYLIPLAAILFVGFVTDVARGDGPLTDPPLSEAPYCLRLEPGGSFSVPVVVRGTDSHVMPGVEVRIVFSANCDQLLFCAGEGPVMTGITDDEGAVEFFPRVGGCCSWWNAAEISADPGDVTLAEYSSIGSPDSDGDGIVGLTDFTRFEAAFLGTDACHDLDGCDDYVGMSDFTVFEATFGSVCP